MTTRLVFLLLFVPLVFIACGGDEEKDDGCACGCGDPTPCGPDTGQPDGPDTPQVPEGPTPQDEQEIDSLLDLTKDFLAELKTIKSVDGAKAASPKLKELGAKITKIGWGKAKTLLANSKNWSKDSIAKWSPKIKQLLANSWGVWKEKRRITKDDDLKKALEDVDDLFPGEEPTQEPG